MRRPVNILKLLNDGQWSRKSDPAAECDDEPGGSKFTGERAGMKEVIDW